MNQPVKPVAPPKAKNLQKVKEAIALGKKAIQNSRDY